eukprot:334270-Hanusia_phi.AAC.4
MGRRYLVAGLRGSLVLFLAPSAVPRAQGERREGGEKGPVPGRGAKPAVRWMARSLFWQVLAEEKEAARAAGKKVTAPNLLNPYNETKHRRWALKTLER